MELGGDGIADLGREPIPERLSGYPDEQPYVPTDCLPWGPLGYSLLGLCGLSRLNLSEERPVLGGKGRDAVRDGRLLRDDLWGIRERVLY